MSHIHTYRRHRTNPSIYYCIGESCYHKIEREFLKGKTALCPTCGNEMVLGYEELRRAFPKCATCRTGRSTVNEGGGSVEFANAEELLVNLKADLTDTFGKPCEKFDSECGCCRIWAAYDEFERKMLAAFGPIEG